MNNLQQRLEQALLGLRAMLIDDWRRAPHFLSVQIHVAALAYLSIYSVMPVLDPTIAQLLPSPLQARFVGGYALLGIVARVIAQKTPGG